MAGVFFFLLSSSPFYLVKRPQHAHDFAAVPQLDHELLVQFLLRRWEIRERERERETVSDCKGTGRAGDGEKTKRRRRRCHLSPALFTLSPPASHHEGRARWRDHGPAGLIHGACVLCTGACELSVREKEKRQSAPLQLHSGEAPSRLFFFFACLRSPSRIGRHPGQGHTHPHTHTPSPLSALTHPVCRTTERRRPRKSGGRSTT